MPPSDPILEALGTCPALDELAHRLPPPGRRVVVGGAPGSAAVALAAALHRRLPRHPLILLAEDPRKAAAVEADLQVLLGVDGPARLYPQKESLPYEEHEPHLEIGGLRVEAVEAFLSGRARILVTTPRALQERVPMPRELTELRLTLRVGRTVEFSALPAALEARGFERVPLVEQVGQFAVRGGLLDLYSVGAGDPVRVEFWGDEIVSIRTFDLLDQRSVSQLEETHVLPVDFHRSGATGSSVRRSLLDLAPPAAPLLQLGSWDLAAELRRTWTRAVAVYEELTYSGAEPAPPDHLFMAPERVVDTLANRPAILLTSEPEGDIVLGAGTPPAIERDMGRLDAYLREGAATGERTLLLCDNDGQLQRLEELLGGSALIPSGATLAIGALDTGFTLPCADPPPVSYTHLTLPTNSRV